MHQNNGPHHVSAVLPMSDDMRAPTLGALASCTAPLPLDSQDPAPTPSTPSPRARADYGAAEELECSSCHAAATAGRMHEVHGCFHCLMQ